MRQLLNRAFDGALDLLLTRGAQARLGRRILNHARGEGNGDPVTNGEYALLRAVKRRWEREGTAPTLFDVGANVGDWSEEALRGLPAATQLFVFEPSEPTFARLQTRLGAWPAHVRAHNFAIGDADGSAMLYVDTQSRLAGTNSLHRRRAEVHFELRQEPSSEVRVRTGDAVCVEAGVERIHLLKIDTEGHEVAVLKGFARMFRERRIDVVQFEYGAAWSDARALLVDAFDFLQPHGYGLAKLHPDGAAFFDAYDQREETFAFANYVACRPELAPELRTLDA